MLLFAAACVSGADAPAGTPDADSALPLACTEPSAGIDRFTRQDAARGLTIPFEYPWDAWDGMITTGVALMAVDDLDADGDLDFMQGRLAGAPMVFANDGKGFFASAIDLPALVAPPEIPMLGVLSISTADLDGDALPDVIAAGRSFVEVYWNLGGLSFSQPIAIHIDPIAGDAIYQPLSLADFDGDGVLDMALPPVTHATAPPGEDGVPLPIRMYYQRDGTFVRGPDLVANGIGSVTLVSLASDRDADGDMDLFVFADRLFPNLVWRNDGVGSDGFPVFVEEAADLVLDAVVAAMGVDSADLNGDGALDYCVTDTTPPKCWLSDGAGRYYEGALALGLVPADPADETYGTVGWSFDLVDLDNDAALDAVQASGPCTNQIRDGVQVPYADLLWHGTAEGTFVDVSEAVGFADTSDNYSMVTADFDGDGAWEIVVGGPGAPPTFYQNRCTVGAWLDILLVGAPGNAPAFGARVEVDVGGVTQIREQYGLRSPASGPREMHFGLGNVDVVDAIRVLWPDGERSEVGQTAARQRLVIGR